MRRYRGKARHSVLALLLGLTMLFAGCDGVSATEITMPPAASGMPSTVDGTEQEQSPDGQENQQPSSDTDLPSSGDTGAEIITALEESVYTFAYVYADEDTNSALNENDATTIVFAGGTAQVSGAGASFANGVLSITRAGTFLLSGTLTNGQVLIDATKNDLVRLVLNDVSLHNENGPAIYAPQADKVVIILADGTQNTVSDGAAYAATGEDDPNAAIYVQDDLSITGGGQLIVTGSYKHGIRAQDHLVITSGTINVTAAGDALRGRDGVTIQDGIFTLVTGGDGIQSNNANSEDVGFIIINGGTFDIQAKNDGIQAESALTVTGGTFNILTGGGSANAPTRAEDFRGGMGGRPGQGQTTTTTTEEESASMKALKAGKLVYITGGTFTVDAEDDAVHSNGDVLIKAGKMTLKTGDDGIHADAATIITGGTIHIPVCYEGIEGLSVTISGGDISVIAGDDAINAAGGVDSMSQWGGPMGGDRFAANGDIFIRISGGNLDLYAPYDGIDSNGNVFLEGGMVKVSGPSQSMDGAVDLDGTMLVTGGELITAGSVVNVSSESTQPTLLVSYTQQQVSGSVITVADAKGNTILSYTSAIAYTMSGFTSPSFAIGETYTLSIDGVKKTDVTLTGAVTSIADDGGAYSGMGGMGGMGGGRGNWGGGMPTDGTMPFNREMPADGEMPFGGRLPSGGEIPSGSEAPSGGTELRAPSRIR